MAAEDVKVALGLLDLRHLPATPKLTRQLRAAAVEQWRRNAPRSMSQLREVTKARWAAHGELAFLLEGDVKEARGGLRDVAMLRGIGTAGVADASPPPVRAAHTRLLDVRDALHTSAGRRVDRLLAQERDAVATLLGLAERRRRCCAASPGTPAPSPTPPTTPGAPSTAGGPTGAAPAHAPRYAGRSAATWSSRTAKRCWPARRSAPRPDPSLALRVAAAAATVRLPIARPTLEWLARFCPPPPVPWPAPAREALLTLLGSGTGLVPDLGGVRPLRPGGRLAAGVEPAARPAPAQPGAPLHRRPAPGAGGRRGGRVHPRGGPPRPAAARRVAARRRQGAAGGPQPGRGAAGARHRARSWGWRRPTRCRSRSWSGCTCCCPTRPPGGTSPTR